MDRNSVSELIKIWLDMMRPVTQHLVDESCVCWHPTLVYYNSIAKIEFIISQKLEISAPEAKIMLLNKKKMKDSKEEETIKKRKKLS